MNRVFRLYVEGDEVVFGAHRIALLDFPSWWQKGYNEDSQKSAIEDKETGDVVDASPESVTALVSYVRFAAQEGEIPIDLALDFLRAVCYWGNGARVWGTIRKGHRGHLNGRSISESLLAAIESLNEMHSDVILPDKANLHSFHSFHDYHNDWRAKVMREINKIHGLGSPSFSSKVARFLAPEQCGVWDSLVADVLELSEASSMYFVDYCLHISVLVSELNVRGIECPRAGSTTWEAADVDLVLWTFAKYGIRASESTIVLPEGFINLPNHELSLKKDVVKKLISAKCHCGKWREKNERKDPLIVGHKAHCRDLGLL